MQVCNNELDHHFINPVLTVVGVFFLSRGRVPKCVYVPLLIQQTLSHSITDYFCYVNEINRGYVPLHTVNPSSHSRSITSIPTDHNPTLSPGNESGTVADHEHINWFRPIGVEPPGTRDTHPSQSARLTPRDTHPSQSATARHEHINSFRPIGREPRGTKGHSHPSQSATARL